MFKYIALLNVHTTKQLTMSGKYLRETNRQRIYYGANISLYFKHHMLHIMYDVYNLCTVSEFVCTDELIVQS